MEISALQHEVDTWIKTYGVRYFNELTNTAILMEEVGELARIMARKYGEQSFKNKEEEKQKELMEYPIWECVNNHIMHKWFLKDVGLYENSKYLIG